MYVTDLYYRTLSVQLTGVYLYAISEKVELGAGAGVRYTFKAEGTIESSSDGKAPESNYAIPYRNKVTLLLPLEAHYKLSNRFTLLAQMQLQLTNRLKDAREGFWERDLSGAVGVNYRLK
ncbi:hypothetical protein [Pontibacter pudoricolor]|uniref:hypothetical protein n=1 Tax=Pontibacter pudoricolor TaxID=2694930 RepID=UPI0013913B6A|nr:hypothetical protein [Pontibacter pudoricolor]